ncbi:hypothetical protein M0804_011040 [Polistes exclamans]|nr:hypothetical protein M0804_011040 [Polistes exclamans]
MKTFCDHNDVQSDRSWVLLLKEYLLQHTTAQHNTTQHNRTTTTIQQKESKEGIGSLKVVPGGIELRGQAAILDTLVASNLKSRKGENLVLESWSNFTATARSHDGRLLARLTVGEDRFDCISKGFRITDPRGGVLFSANREQVLVGADMLKVTGDGGAVFQGSVQTPLVRGESGRGLRLESATRSIKISAPQRVVLESWANEISASCLTDLKVQSVHGAIRLDSKSVFLKGLKTAVTVQGRSSRETQQQQQQQQQQPQLQLQLQQQQPQEKEQEQKQEQHQQQQQQQQRSSRSSIHQNQRETSIYQLCACANGKLFLARPEEYESAYTHGVGRVSRVCVCVCVLGDLRGNLINYDDYDDYDYDYEDDDDDDYAKDDDDDDDYDDDDYDDKDFLGFCGHLCDKKITVGNSVLLEHHKEVNVRKLSFKVATAPAPASAPAASTIVK